MSEKDPGARPRAGRSETTAGPQVKRGSPHHWGELLIEKLEVEFFYSLSQDGFLVDKLLEP